MWEKFRQTQLLCLTEFLPPFISQTLRDGTPQVLVIVIMNCGDKSIKLPKLKRHAQNMCGYLL